MYIVKLSYFAKQVLTFHIKKPAGPSTFRSTQELS